MESLGHPASREVILGLFSGILEPRRVYIVDLLWTFALRLTRPLSLRERSRLAVSELAEWPALCSHPTPTPSSAIPSSTLLDETPKAMARPPLSSARQDWTGYEPRRAHKCPSLVTALWNGGALGWVALNPSIHQSLNPLIPWLDFVPLCVGGILGLHRRAAGRPETGGFRQPHKLRSR